MKIERISENQIRCTLYKADLADKELLLTELAYGTDKAKELFRELMQQASTELGFEVDNIPLMIEAIPVSPDCLILIITKVEDPDELDTRFSRFTKHVEAARAYGEADEDDEEDDMEIFYEGQEDDMDSSEKSGANAAEGLLEALGNLADGLSKRMGAMSKTQAKKADAVVPQDVFRIYAFKSLDQVILSANLVRDFYDSSNSLYKNPKDSCFYLYMTKDNNSDIEFVRSCNLISEYGNKVKASYATPGHMKEHFKVIIDGNALQTLADL